MWGMLVHPCTISTAMFESEHLNEFVIADILQYTLQNIIDALHCCLSLAFQWIGADMTGINICM